MRYRFAEEKDLSQIIKLCDDNNIDFPYDSKLLVAENNEGRIVAMLGVKIEMFYEPLVSKNSLAAMKLFRISENILKDQVNHIRCICDDSNEILFNKLGFETIESKKLIMQKEY